MEPARATEASSFGKYTLVAKLATGGMAEIFLARLLAEGGFEKLICIKRILPHLAKDPQFVAMFLDEARVVARISHPNVCQVFELGEIDGQYYIAMEYLAGVPLSVFRRTDTYPGAPDPRLVAGFGMQACEGLHHAHQLKNGAGEMLGVVHRDITPQNLFVTVDGIVKVLDFGIAKVQDQSIRTSTGAMKGTYCYMAPEQLRGEKVDRRVDVWALGTVLWETLAQRHLFKRETEFLTFQAITTEPIPDICEIRPDIPPAFGEVIGKAITRDREQRYPTARALGEALGQAAVSLGGPLGAAAISDEVEGAFAMLMDEQRQLLGAARAGDIFDLERSNPLGGASTKLMTTPVSNIRGKLEAAQAEVAAYVAAQQKTQIEPLPVAVPPPTGSYQTRDPMMPTLRSPSRLPWIIAGVAVIVSGVIGFTLLTKKDPPAAPPPPVKEDVVVMNTAPVVDAAVVEATVPRDAAPEKIEKIEKIDPPKQIVQPKKAVVKAAPVVKEPVVTGPPGHITIDSSPVYAHIAIDGKSMGDTPLVNIELPPGKHVVKATSASGSTRSLTIQIEPGKTAPVRRIEW
ncbi:MAG: serine/threonine-protein kinase [Kofleriaceae bacterium]